MADQRPPWPGPITPWIWDSRYGEWGLWDAAGNPLVMEYHFVEPGRELDPYVDAVTAVAPEMEELLREVYAATADGEPIDEQRWRNDRRPRIAALLERLDEARKAGG